MKHEQIANCTFDLAERHVHVWSVQTQTSSDVAGRFEQVLVRDERNRASRFGTVHLQNSFVIARGTLRILLGSYMEVAPVSIEFKYGSKGKPTVAAPKCIDFNVAHSGGLTLFAFTAGCDIGVDVEQIREVPDLLGIADRFFCSEEAAELRSLTADQRARGFFHCWTRKEAYIKAIGAGLSAPLDSFRVTLQPSHNARFIHLDYGNSPALAWVIHDLQLATNYAAALAYRDKERPVVVIPIIDPAVLLQLPRRTCGRPK